MTDSKEWIPVSEAAVRLRISKQYAHRLVKEGRLKSHRTLPKKTLVSVASIESLIDANNRNN